MTNDRHDADLRAAFDGLRDTVDHSTPDFRTMMEAARRDAEGLPQLSVVDGAGIEQSIPEKVDQERRRGARVVRIGGWVSLAAAAATAGLLMINPPVDQADAEFEALVASYSTVARAASPTAGLLDLPGIDLGSVPRIGTPPVTDFEGGVDS